MKTTIYFSGFMALLACIVIILEFKVVEQAKEEVYNKNITEELIRLAPENAVFNDNLQNKKLVLNLWATWCNPCIKEIPQLNELVQQRADSLVVFIALSTDFEKRSENFLEKNDILFHYQRFYEGKDRPFSLYNYLQNLNVSTESEILPLHVLVNRDGTLYEILTGNNESNIETIRNFLDKKP